ncbi:MAG: tyrosine--tRNA ligase [Dehalococcoidales bacterium]|nr:tyrosine--tRNA ligase [Dehalococcoidales bacterium]
MSVFDEYKWRGLLYDSTEGLEEILAKEKISAYIGFDPSAHSLHVGNLIPIIGLMHLQRYGHTPIPVIGGGTGLIGDPSGRTTERQLLTKELLAYNLEGIRDQLSRFLDFDSKTNPAVMVNNADWLTTTSVTDFLRDIGKHFSVNAMLGKESVKMRLNDEGISYTEFSYMLLQSFDYLTLFEKYNCTLQMGASDQWGNITAGIDLIRRVHGAKAHCLVFPLLTTSSGVKFGKSVGGGSLWLDPELTSPYNFYQYFINTEDNDVGTYLKFFTFLSQEEVFGLEESVKSHPEKREAQKKLAQEITRLVHGDDALAKAEEATQVLFGGSVENLGLKDIMEIFSAAPSVEIAKNDVSGDGMSLPDLVVIAGLAKSKGEARRTIEGGGINIQNIRETSVKRTVTINDAIEGKAIVLRKGQKDYRLVLIADE